MKRVSFLRFFTALIVSFLLSGAGSFGPRPALAFPGVPGCWKEMDGHPMNDHLAKLKLSPPCLKLRERYQENLQRFIEKPNKLVQALSEDLTSKKSLKNEETPYDAILFSLFVEDASLLSALKIRAEAEKKNKVFYSFAAAAIERIQSGKCLTFKSPVYDEICTAKDMAFERVKALHEADARMTK